MIENKLTYNGPVSNPTAYFTMSILHCNIFLFNPEGKYLIVDFNNFYLNNQMKKAKYYKISIKLIPREIINSMP